MRLVNKNLEMSLHKTYLNKVGIKLLILISNLTNFYYLNIKLTFYKS